MLEKQIIETVQSLERRYGRVYPKHVAMKLCYTDRHMRMIMADLAKAGQLERLSARGGYTSVSSVRA